MENTNINPDDCTGSQQGGHRGEYGKVGFSPCKAYVSHESNTPCNVIENITEDTPNNCSCIPPKSPCRTEPCPCGSFVSHRVAQPCTAVTI